MMGEPPDLHVDMDSLDASGKCADVGAGLVGRPWVGIHFDCCGVYTRVYRNREGTAYRGSCPQCMRKVALRVGQSGTDARFFIAE